MKIPLIVIAGPTACGKTDISINLAKKINGEIISADSMQVYKYMDIGTAKASIEDMKGIKHHLINILYPDQDFSVAVFKDMAKASIQDIYSRGKIPILVGGTGFYINALIYDVNFTQEDSIVSSSFRDSFYNILEEKGSSYLYNMLKEIDAEATKFIHENNTKRVIRALEYYKVTGQKISDHNKQEQLREEAYNTSFFILNRERKNLYENINKRVDKMINDGLVDEVKHLVKLGYDKDLVSMNGIGYKEIIDYLQGHTTLDEAIELIKRNTRRFAKRQVTWFKNKSNGIWIDIAKYESKDTVVDTLLKTINF